MKIKFFLLFIVILTNQANAQQWNSNGNNTSTGNLNIDKTITSSKLLLKDPNTTTDWNTLWQSGFYESLAAKNAPESAGWFWGINFNHRSNSPNYRYNGQIAIKNNSSNPTMYFRSTTANGTGIWTKVLHSKGDQSINGKLNISANVGIGTKNPGAWKLAVNGKIRAKEVKVETGWADFVFYDDYELPTLEEVESHIEEKGHLKDIPSAKEVEENGILVGEMNSKLLQKIEELTLYTIAQEKKLKAQEAEITTLKALVDRVTTLEKKIGK